MSPAVAFFGSLHFLAGFIFFWRAPGELCRPSQGVRKHHHFKRKPASTAWLVSAPRSSVT